MVHPADSFQKLFENYRNTVSFTYPVDRFEFACFRNNQKAFYKKDALQTAL